MFKLYQQRGHAIIHSLLTDNDKIVQSWVYCYSLRSGKHDQAMDEAAARWVGTSGLPGILDEAGFALIGTWETYQEYIDWTHEQDNQRR